jgi:hypothetical protein
MQRGENMLHGEYYEAQPSCGEANESGDADDEVFQGGELVAITLHVAPFSGLLVYATPRP